jgi:hypothetical protein
MTGECGRILVLEDDDADFADVRAAFLREQGHRATWIHRLVEAAGSP